MRLLVDVPVRQSALVFGIWLHPRVYWWWGAEGRGPATDFLVSGGASVGYLMRVTDGLRILLEVGLEMPLHQLPAGPGWLLARRSPAVQFNWNVLIGSTKPPLGR